MIVVSVALFRRSVTAVAPPKPEPLRVSVSVSPRAPLAGVTAVTTGATATAVTLLLNNATDTTITVANLVVNADGTQVTMDITIDAGAPLGARVVQITTPTGSSTAAGTGGNLFTVQ